MITVVTITFNNPDEFTRTVKSIPKDPRIEHLVINGGKDVRTAEYLVQNGMRNISEPDSGISDAFNKGLKNASGEGIIYINSGDVLIKPEYLFYCDDLLAKDLSVDFIYSSILFKSTEKGTIHFQPSKQKGEMPFPHPSLMIRKKTFDEIGPFELRYKIAMDFDIAYRLIKHSKKGVRHPNGPVVEMDGGGASSTRGPEGVDERLHILKTHGLLDRDTYLFLLKTKYKSVLKTSLDGLRLSFLHRWVKIILEKGRQ